MWDRYINFFFSSRRRHTRSLRDWSSDVCSSDLTDAARALEEIPGVPSLLWYPVKALTRPRALIAELAKLGVHGTAVELHWTPLRLRREKLNGAGLIFVSTPREAVASLCAALPELGAALQTHGEW